MDLKTIWDFWFTSKTRFGRTIILFPRMEEGFTLEFTRQMKEVHIMFHN